MRLVFGVCLALWIGLASSVAAQFTIQGPGVDPADFQLTTFASGLDFPVGMQELSDGSIMVAMSNGSFFGSSSGSILRLADTNGDGVADEETTLVDDVPGGGLTALCMAGDLVFATGQGSGRPISIHRVGATPSDSLTLVGLLSIQYSSAWLHPHSALAVREAPGMAGSFELFFQLGSKANFADTTDTLVLSSTIGGGGTVAGDAVHRILITDHGTSVSASGLTQIATGLRNAAGFAFHPDTGDLYIQDNGIDGLADPNEPLSADELNMIARDDIGGSIEDFGFPTTYVEYRTNTVIGSDGIQPLVAFQPIPSPAGDESEGPNDIAFAPRFFPEALRNGMFVGMHGRFSDAGVANEENPLVFVDLTDDSYFHFVGNDEPGVGHLDGLLATSDSLYIADLSPDGGFGSNDVGEGVIYRLRSVVTGVIFVDGFETGDTSAWSYTTP